MGHESKEYSAVEQERLANEWIERFERRAAEEAMSNFVEMAKPFVALVIMIIMLIMLFNFIPSICHSIVHSSNSWIYESHVLPTSILALLSIFF